ncbi:MAG: 4Fe-4S dicluster domain-containing protein [Bacteroidia bacterium]|nr:4Fe-4S dicluster domain-containing protein [Bacteroidia bacterium]
MNNLSAKAKELLDTKAVNVLIGYETGPTGIVRPAFITDPSKTDKLIYDEHCIHNLAVYLTKPEVRKLGKIGIVATLTVMRSIMMLISEQQITADDIVVLGISSDGKLHMEWHILRAMHLAGRCISCGECGRACPVGIPCHLLTMHLADQTQMYFNVHAGTSDKMKSVLSVYEPGDKENFII